MSRMVFYGMMMTTLVTLPACSQNTTSTLPTTQSISASSTTSSSTEVSNTKPCESIKSACQQGGYFKGGHTQGKGLWKNCVNNLLSGKPIPGINVNSSDVAACKAKKAAIQNAGDLTSVKP